MGDGYLVVNMAESLVKTRQKSFHYQSDNASKTSTYEHKLAFLMRSDTNESIGKHRKIGTLY